MNSLGERIKYHRKNKSLTLKDLSSITGLSVGFISNIERNQNSPSVSNLQQICAALNVNLMEIIEDKRKESPILRSDERKEVFTSTNDQAKIELLAKEKYPLNAIAITIDGSSEYNELSWGHDYDEVGIVVKGSLEIELDSAIHTLYEGDSIYLEKFSPHKYRNPSNDKSIVHWFSVKK